MGLLYTQVNVVTTEFSDWATNCPDPRMRTAIFAYVDQGGEGLDPLVKEAILDLKAAREHGESGLRGT